MYSAANRVPDTLDMAYEWEGFSDSMGASVLPRPLLAASELKLLTTSLMSGIDQAVSD